MSVREITREHVAWHLTAALYCRTHGGISWDGSELDCDVARYEPRDGECWLVPLYWREQR